MPHPSHAAPGPPGARVNRPPALPRPGEPRRATPEAGGTAHYSGCARPSRHSPASGPGHLLPGAREVPLFLARLNAAPRAAAEAELLACCGSRRWAERIALHRPYPDVEALLAAADEAAYDMAPADLDEALAAEHETTSGPAVGSAAARTALDAAHSAYRTRFGHAFLVCLSNCHPDEALDTVLASMRARLSNDPDDERTVASEELRQIVLSRLRRLAGAGEAVGAAAADRVGAAADRRISDHMS